MARWALLTAVALGAVFPARAAVVGKLNHVGLPGAVGATFGRDEGLLIRHGKWAPVSVDLRVEGGQHFSGLLRVAQRDNDGDIVASDVPVTLTAGAERSRTFWLYFLPKLDGNQELDFSLQLLEVGDDETERVTVIVTPDGAAADHLAPAGSLLAVNDDSAVILDISARQVDAIHWLVRTDEKKPKLRRPHETARLAADKLPDAWYGLEIVDYIIWDAADPSVFDESQRQLEAIIEWVHQGGCLVVASEQRWRDLAQSALGPYLPVTAGEVTKGPRYPGLEGLVRAGNADQWPEQDVSFCRIQPRTGTRSVPSDPRFRAGAGGGTIVYERQVGHGRIVAVGARLQNLLNPGGLPAGRRPEDALARILRAPQATPEVEEQFGAMERRLFPEVRRFIDFQAAAGVRLAIAILFVVAYILLATFGSWEWLRRRGRLKHSWSAFAALAVVASAFSVLGVGWVQGFRRQIQQLTIVDGEARTNRARAHAFFGVKTPTHTNVDLWLPRDWARDSAPDETPCWLRPIPGAAAGLDTGYAAPGRYRIQPARATLGGVPIRATLKQVAGYWTGNLPGQLQASIRIREFRDPNLLLEDGTTWLGSAREITADSWLANELKVDLVDSYLLHSMWVWPGEEGVPPRRDQDIYIRRLGPIADGERINDLHAQLYETPNGEAIVPYQRAARMKEELTPYSLMDAHMSWAGGRGFAGAFTNRADFTGLDSWDRGIMLLTTLGEYIGDYPRSGSSRAVADPLSGGHARSLDRSVLLAPDTVMFVGFAADAGPARLKIRRAGASDDAWKVLHPNSSAAAQRTIYRITIPVSSSRASARRGPGSSS